MLQQHLRFLACGISLVVSKLFRNKLKSCQSSEPTITLPVQLLWMLKTPNTPHKVTTCVTMTVTQHGEALIPLCISSYTQVAQVEVRCCRQARKLQEMFQKVQQENELLRSGRRPVTQAPLAGSGPHFNSLLSPPHNVRHQSNTPGSGRVVCTSSS